MKHLPTTPALCAFRAGRTVDPIWVSPTGRAFYPIAGASPDGDDDGGGDDDGSDAFKAITSQGDLDRALGKRLAREREKFADYDSLKAKAAEHDAALAAAMTEQEKAIAAARKEGETVATQANTTRLVRAEARALAATAGFRNPSIAVGALDLTGVTIGDDGEVDAAAIKAKLKALSDADPYLVDDGKSRPKPDRAQNLSGDGKASMATGRDLYAERYKKTSAS